MTPPFHCCVFSGCTRKLTASPTLWRQQKTSPCELRRETSDLDLCRPALPTGLRWAPLLPGKFHAGECKLRAGKVGANLPGREGSAGKRAAAARPGCAGCLPVPGAWSLPPPTHLPGAGCAAGASWRGPAASGLRRSGCSFPAGSRGTGTGWGWVSRAGTARAPRLRSPRRESWPRSTGPVPSAAPARPAARRMRDLRGAAGAPRGLGRAEGRSGPSPPCSFPGRPASERRSPGLAGELRRPVPPRIPGVQATCDALATSQCAWSHLVAAALSPRPLGPS